MAVVNTLDKIIDDIEQTKNDGYKNLDIEKMLMYLENLKQENVYDHDVQMELLKSSNTSQIEIAKMNHAASLEAFRSVITVGANAARAFMIINGGAAIALLAFLGNVWNKDSSPDVLSSILGSLLIFCIGVLCSGVCSGFTYLAQYCYATSELGSDSKWKMGGDINNIIAILSGVSSLILFGVGAYVTYASMGNQFG